MRPVSRTLGFRGQLPSWTCTKCICWSSPPSRILFLLWLWIAARAVVRDWGHHCVRERKSWRPCRARTLRLLQSQPAISCLPASSAPAGLKQADGCPSKLLLMAERGMAEDRPSPGKGFARFVALNSQASEVLEAGDIMRRRRLVVPRSCICLSVLVADPPTAASSAKARRWWTRSAPVVQNQSLRLRLRVTAELLLFRRAERATFRQWGL